MMLGVLTAEFPWGVLLISDRGSTEQIPEWDSPQDQVTGGATCLLVRVRHADEGPVTVRVWDGTHEVAVLPTAVRLIDSFSGRLVVSDALGDQSIDISVPAGTREIAIFLNRPVEATEVDVVVA